MFLYKIYAVAFLALTVNADKKIELEDIEEDNLKSEREKHYEKVEPRSQGPTGNSGPGGENLGYLNNNFIQYYDAPSPSTPQPRYVQQYAVTEAPEGLHTAPKPQYEVPQQQQVSYLPMQFYLVPQYYNEPQGNSQQDIQYTAPAPQVSNYPSAPGPQHHPNFIVPTFIAPTGKFVQQYTTPVAYIYPQPTLQPPQPSPTPIVNYQNPVVNYPTAIIAPPIKNYQQNQYSDNSIDHVLHGQRQYSSQPEVTYFPPQTQEYPRYYNSRAPVREEYRSGSIELPHPSPLLLKPSPPHLSHIPKALPTYRPLTKPIYSTTGPLISNTFTPKPSEAYGVPFKRRPASLLESYIPSSIQLEYLKRGYTKDNLALYDALSNGRGYTHFPVPRHYERGFLPNQMYHTAAGGITYGHHKRASKILK